MSPHGSRYAGAQGFALVCFAGRLGGAAILCHGYAERPSGLSSHSHHDICFPQRHRLSRSKVDVLGRGRGRAMRAAAGPLASARAAYCECLETRTSGPRSTCPGLESISQIHRHLPALWARAQHRRTAPVSGDGPSDHLWSARTCMASWLKEGHMGRMTNLIRLEALVAPVSPPRYPLPKHIHYGWRSPSCVQST